MIARVSSFLILLFMWQAINPLSGRGDKEDIEALLQMLASAAQEGKDVDVFLSPRIDGQARFKELARISDQYEEFQISGYDLARHLLITNDQARLPVSIHWKTSHLEADTESIVRFERVDGKWYFASYDFAEFPWRTTIGMIALGILYSAIVTAYLIHWRRRQTQYNHYTRWFVLLFTPIGWVLYSLLKPWVKRPREPIN